VMDDCKICDYYIRGPFFYEYSQELGVKCILGHRFFDYYLTLLPCFYNPLLVLICPSLIFIIDI
jgi:hypothetical protein